MSALITQAALFAITAHGDQKRKYTGEPYFVHLAEVAHTIAMAGGRDEMIAAAYLHDVVEDTAVTDAQVEDEFGRQVATLVYWLTDASKPSDGNRAARKAIDRAHIAGASPDAKSIKLADLLSNTTSIVARDPEFAKVYLEEKRALLEVLRDASMPALWTAASRIANADAYDEHGFQKAHSEKGST